MARSPQRRRRAYRTRIYKGTYFIAKHIGKFAQSRVKSLAVPGAKVADVGCGEQPLRALVESLGARHTGIDVEQNGQGTVDIVASMVSVPTPDSEYDVVMCTEVLEHVSNTYQAFHELARITKAGGHIILTTPFWFPLHEEPFDFVRLTPHQLRECANLYGLSVKELAISGNELEVFATAVDYTCQKMSASLPALLRMPGLALLRLLINPLTIVGTAIIGRWLPGTYFLSTFCVLEKPSPALDSARMSALDVTSTGRRSPDAPWNRQVE